MDELPEEAIQEAEAVTRAHSHDGVSSADRSLVDHLLTAHRFETEPDLSASTQEGLHDRLHHETDVAAD